MIAGITAWKRRRQTKILSAENLLATPPTQDM
jgi:hypothetical protein